jgi:hypothetical protein
MFRTVALAALLASSAVVIAADPPKGISDALKVLEKAHADAKEPVEKAKLAEAIAALKSVSESRKVQNHLVSDFVDNPEDYAGRVLTFRMTYSAGDPLNKRSGGANVPFDAVDSKNEAKLLLGLDIPADIKLPAAKRDEVVIVTFKAGSRKKKEPNVAIAITRP